MSDLNNLINNIVEKAVAESEAIHVLRCNMQTMIKQVLDLQDRIGATYALSTNAIDRVKALESNVKPIAPPTPEEIDDLMAALLRMSEALKEPQQEAEPESEPLSYDDLAGIVRQVVREEIGNMLGSGRTVTVTISD